jgi:hypothetical protein
MTRQYILDRLEEMHDECSKEFLGSNEADLHFKEDVADWILSLIKESDSLLSVNQSQPFDIHNCINHVCDAVEAKIPYVSLIRPIGNRSFRWRVKQAIDKMLTVKA